MADTEIEELKERIKTLKEQESTFERVELGKLTRVSSEGGSSNYKIELTPPRPSKEWNLYSESTEPESRFWNGKLPAPHDNCVLFTTATAHLESTLTELANMVRLANDQYKKYLTDAIQRAEKRLREIDNEGFRQKREEEEAEALVKQINERRGYDD